MLSTDDFCIDLLEFTKHALQKRAVSSVLQKQLETEFITR
jgi:hypothetical protein